MKHMWSEEEIASQKKDIATLVDSKGNPRFVEGEGTPATIEGFTSTYCKWSLSGTHLMIVLAGSISNGVTISAQNIAEIKIPNFILEKIFVIYGNVVENKEATLYAIGQNNQTLPITLTKGATSLSMYRGGSTTLNADRAFRLQFDLLIDSE